MFCNRQHLLRKLLIAFSVTLSLAFGFVQSGCRIWDNSMTYFNTYYNAKKLMNDTEDEFGYQNEIQKPPKPRVVAPIEPDITLEKKTGALPKYLDDMVIKQQQLAPVQIKVDSIIIKGSKILATHPKSDLVDGTIFLMAKAFFYRSEWLPSAIKCQELIETQPESYYLSDAHLLASKCYLIQRSIPKAKLWLSRTIDVAWQQERMDVLSEAFRLQAELAIEEEQYDEAERPYRQAIAQTNDSRQKAKWETDLGLVLYRVRKFDKAEKELAKALTHNTDNLCEFEAKVYRASSLARLERYSEANAILDEIETSRKYDDYLKFGYVTAERMRWLRLAGKQDSLDKYERIVDTSSVGSPSVLVANFERGMEYFREKDYDKARKYFAKSKTVRSPVFDGANQLYNLLNIREDKLLRIATTEKNLTIAETDSIRDSLRSLRGVLYFELARTHELLGNPDSARKWYQYAVDNTPEKDTARAQYLYSLARMYDNDNREVADSLHEIIFAKYKSTTFGGESRVRLNYTDYAVVDSVADLYKSGSRFRSIGDYPYAGKQFVRVYTEYPNSSYAPRSLYALGWMWERNLNNNDSALYYYSILVKKYPTTEFALDISKNVLYASLHKQGSNDTSGIFNPGARPNQPSLQQIQNQQAPGSLTPNPDGSDPLLNPMKNPNNMIPGKVQINPMNINPSLSPDLLAPPPNNEVKDKVTKDSNPIPINPNPILKQDSSDSTKTQPKKP